MASDPSNASKEPKEGSVTAVAKKRKRSKWDQPAEPFASITGPLTTNGTVGISMPGEIPVVNSHRRYTVSETCTIPQAKVQDEPIAREIVINDAEPAMRCKLTKQQTQEEIQKSTGAVVITRGKYRPPNALPNGETPLYLHISAGSHLKDVVERIRAVDKAASIVQDMLKQGQVAQPHTTCVFLGFEADSSLNISSRIRGPHDQFINHIMNETGAAVVLRGRGSGNSSSVTEELSQPLHLFLSSANAKSLASARILADNLLDTIAAECGSSRIQSYKVFGAIPPPPYPSSALTLPVPGIPGVPPKPVPALPPPRIYPPRLATPVPQPTAPPYFINPVPTSGTHYSGHYEGLYPQATPLQQVALALKQASPATVTLATANVSIAAPASSVPSNIVSSSSSVETNRKSTQKRKFQELPISDSKDSTGDQQNLRQGSEFFKAGLEESNSSSRIANSMAMPPPRKLVESPTNAMMPPPPPPPKSAMPPPPPPSKSVMPPPPPKFSSIEASSTIKRSNSSSSKPDLPLSSPVNPPAEKLQAEPASETLLKLVEYGEEEDDDEPDQANISFKSNPTLISDPKPFWAV